VKRRRSCSLEAGSRLWSVSDRDDNSGTGIEYPYDFLPVSRTRT
jgi:hypothetical protein